MSEQISMAAIRCGTTAGTIRTGKANLLEKLHFRQISILTCLSISIFVPG
jgi:hypothetical protein